MAKKSRSPSKPASPSRRSSPTAAGRTAGGPSKGSAPLDAVGRHGQEANQLAAAVPFNADKASEYAYKNAINPPPGTTVDAPSETTGASTLSEANDTGKNGPPTRQSKALDGTLAPQRVNDEGQALTTNQGVRVGSNQSSLKAGLRGPTLLEDFILREKITHFDHERIPERIVHARGSGAHGFFECTRPMSEVTKAAPFQQSGKVTPVFVRFSTVAGERGSADTARDVRGFAIKFYTDEGNWDLVGNNIPVFFIQDAIKFPDLIHSVKPEPHNGMPQAASAHDTFWDFASLMPESTHMLTWVMSDRGIPRSYRMMQGFGVHTFRLVNADGDSVFCKFHFKPVLGTHSLVWDESAKLMGADPDYHRRDLWEAIESGNYPEWEMGLQVFTERQAEKFSFDVLDSTKLIPEELVPVEIVGRLVLNRNPDNFFAETEQVAFCTAHVIPGIDFSNDPLLHGRIHSYVDTQISRLGGANFHEIPINAPLAPVHNNQRDGIHRQAIARGRVSYEPNSLGGGCPFQAGLQTGFVSYPKAVETDNEPVDKVRGKPEKFAEHYNQATLFYESQTDVEKHHMAGAFRFELSKVTVPAIRQRMVSSLRNVSEQLAATVAEGLGIDLPPAMPRAMPKPPKPEIIKSAVLSLTALPGDLGPATRKVAIAVLPGVATDQVTAMIEGLTAAGVVVRLLGARLGSVGGLEVDSTFENSPSVLFDGFILPGDDAVMEKFSALGQAVEFLKDQFRHCKTVAISAAARPFMERKLGVDAPSGADAGLIELDREGGGVDGFLNALAKHRHFARDQDPPRI